MGHFAANKFEGKGTYTFKDGSEYSGEFKDGYRSGQGTMIFDNGNKYIEGWLNDRQHGIGIFYDAKEE